MADAEKEESSDQEKKTIRYSNTEDKTYTYSDSSKKSRSDSNSSRNPIISVYNLFVGDRIELNQSVYNILEIISDEGVTGEASISKIQDKDGKIFSLKLYPEHRDSKFEPNPLTLSKIKSIEDPDILKLYDFGTGTRKYLEKYCYEISDFAEGGTLLDVKNFKEKYTASFIEDNIVPEIFNGIKTLHKYRIYHCDLKPQNIFYLDKDQTDLIIGDYGSAKTFDELNDKDKRSQIAAVTSTWLGSKNYMALEQNQGIISVKNDYYSFGMIILHLLYPDEFEQGVKGKFISRLVQSQPILENFNKDYHRLNKLIEGLTLVNFNNRWSEQEVESWLQGNPPQVIYSGTSSIPEIKLSANKILRSEEDIIDYIKEEKNWYDKLIVQEDGAGHLFYKWFVEKRGAEEHQIFKEMIKYYRQYGQDYVREAIISFFDPGRNIIVQNKIFNFNEQGKVNSSVKLFFEFLDEIWKTKNIDELKFYIFQLEFALGLAINSEDTALSTEASLVLQTIATEFNVSPRKDFNNYKAEIFHKLNLESLINLFYQFNPQRSFKDLSNKQYNSLEEVGFYFAKNVESFDNTFLKCERERFLKKVDLLILINYTCTDYLFAIFNKHIKSELEFMDILNSQSKEEIIISYKFGKSLTEYFAQNSINNNLVRIAQQSEQIKIKKTPFITSEKLFNKFIKELIYKHWIQKESINSKSFLKFLTDLKQRRKVYRIRKINNTIEIIFQRIGTFIKFLFKEGIISFIIAAFVCILLKDQISQFFNPDMKRLLSTSNDPPKNIITALFNLVFGLIWIIIALILLIIMAVIYGLNEIYLLAILVGLLAAKITKAANE